MIVTEDRLKKLTAAGLVRSSKPVEIDLVSITLRLSHRFLSYAATGSPVPVGFNVPTQSHTTGPDDPMLLGPGQAILASTQEVVDMPLDLMGLVQTKGTVARGFLMAHVCDGQIDPGYKGAITLELVNLGPIQFELRPGDAVANLFILQLDRALKRGYSGRYQGAEGPTSMGAEEIRPLFSDDETGR